MPTKMDFTTSASLAQTETLGLFRMEYRQMENIFGKFLVLAKTIFFKGTKSASEIRHLISAALHGYGTKSDPQYPIEVIFR